MCLGASASTAGGAGAPGTTGNTSNTVAPSTVFGAFTVGGEGNQLTAPGTATSAAVPWYFWLAVGSVGLVAVILLAKSK